jgi:hypothetical protein
MEIAAALRDLYPAHFDAARLLPLLGDEETIERLQRGESADAILQSWESELELFRAVRARYLLYP